MIIEINCGLLYTNNYKKHLTSIQKINLNLREVANKFQIL